MNFILDADIRSFFDAVSQEWLVRFLEHRIGDPRIIRLIRKWLKAGVLEDGVVTTSETGTGQGSVISPLLANIYLHYVFDLWAERWRRREAKGDMIIVRYADDIVVGFEHEADARRFWDAMRERFEEFALSLHPEKTRLIEFGRFAADRRAQRGLGKPETFNFLGFTHICGRIAPGQVPASSGRPGATACGRSSRRSRRSCDGACTSRSPSRGNGWRRSSEATSPITPCRPTRAALGAFRHHVDRPLAAHAPAAQPEGRGLTWERIEQLADDWLPKPRILHPWPEHALRRQTPEVGAGCVNPARPDLCGGRPSNGRPYRDSVRPGPSAIEPITSGFVKRPLTAPHCAAARLVCGRCRASWLSMVQAALRCRA